MIHAHLGSPTWAKPVDASLSLKCSLRNELRHQAASEIQDLSNFCSQPEEQPLLKPVLSGLKDVKVVDALVTPEMQALNADRCLHVTGECITGATGAVLSLCLRRDKLVQATMMTADGQECQLTSLGDGYPEDSSAQGFHLNLEPVPGVSADKDASRRAVLVFHKAGPLINLQRFERDMEGLSSVRVGIECTPGLGAVPAYACLSHEHNRQIRRDLQITGMSPGGHPQVSLSRVLLDLQGREAHTACQDASLPVPSPESRWDLEFRYAAATTALDFVEKFSANSVTARE